jgi:hypothetical protein
VDVEQIDEAVLRERWVGGEAQQPAVPVVVHPRAQVDEGIRQQASAGDDAHHAGLLGNQHAAVWQRRERNRQRQTARHGVVHEAVDHAVGRGPRRHGKVDQYDESGERGLHGGTSTLSTSEISPAIRSAGAGCRLPPAARKGFRTRRTSCPR